MRAIILTAGRGTRISRHIDDKPKCMVSLDGKTTLIGYTVAALRRNRIDDIVIVLGYRGAVIRGLLGDGGIEYRTNPFYDVTNSIASLWFARDVLNKQISGDGRLLLMNGDVYLSDEAFDVILSEKRDPVMFYDVTRRAEADYKFLCDGERLVKYGKELSLEETTGEYVGCATFGSGFVDLFGARLDQLIASQQHSLWWENVLYSMAADRPIIARDIAGAFWGEVDYIEDYERIMEHYTKRGAAHG